MTLASVTELAATFRIPTSTLRRWAVEDGWTRYGSRYRRLYQVEDATRSYTQRRSLTDRDK